MSDVLVQVVYVDSPSLVEIEVNVRTTSWDGRACGYIDPAALTADAMRLRLWDRSGPCETVSTGDTSLRFFTIDAWGHVACRVSIEDKSQLQFQNWAHHLEANVLSVTLATELASIDRLAESS